MLKDLLARFKRVCTVAEWKREAQDAMRNKEFVVDSLGELRRVEKAEGGMMREQVPNRAPQVNHRTQQSQMMTPPLTQQKSFVDSSLKDLMDSIRQQQQVN